MLPERNEEQGHNCGNRRLKTEMNGLPASTQRWKKIRKNDQLTSWEQITAAIGCAVLDPASDTDTEDVFRRADSIMYANKKRMKSGKA